MDEILDSLENSDSTSSYQSTDNGYVSGMATPDTSVSVSESISNSNLQQHSSYANNSLGNGQIQPLADVGIMNPSNSFDHSVTPPSFEYHLQDNIESAIENSIAAQSIDSNNLLTPTLETDAMNNESHSLSATDNLANTPTSDSHDALKDDVEILKSRAEGIERSEHKGEVSFGNKVCPTSHGCSGATSCDCSYGDYPY